MKSKVEGVPDTKKESGKKEYSSFCCRVLPFARQGGNFLLLPLLEFRVRKTERLNICYTHRNSISRTQDNFSNISIHNLNFHSSRTY
jgi:hypothetical protein